MVGERAGTISTASERLRDGGEGWSGRGGTAGGMVCIRDLNLGVAKVGRGSVVEGVANICGQSSSPSLGQDFPVLRVLESSGLGGGACARGTELSNASTFCDCFPFCKAEVSD